ncbi:MAG: hypothetical protein JWO86_1651 [Myxococcaceae bacterium]|nr:hypothetical protein [Myxococcaceae bacterium]
MRLLRLTAALVSTGLGLGLVLGACSSDPAPEPAPIPDAGPETTIDVNQPDTAPPVHIIGGVATGLDGTGLVLQNNAGDDLAVASNGIFTFGTKLPAGTAIAVTVKAEPRKQTCTVSGGTGTVGAGDFTTVAVDCKTDKFIVGGMATGLAAQAVLQNNGGDDITLKADGTFSFPLALKAGVTYAATIKTQPTGPTQTCTVTNGTGTIAAADVTDVTVACTTNTYAIGGKVTGLDSAPVGLVLQNNLGDDLPIPGNGTFAFATPVASGGTYAVTIKAKPAGYNCAIVFAAGTVTSSPITNVGVDCAPM